VIDRSLLPFPVLGETAHELVVIKPAGMASELTSDPKGVSLISRLRRACPPPLEPKLPHRLDRVARGIMLIALTPEAIAFHGAQIRSGGWEKFYLARVHALQTGGTQERGPRDGGLKALLGQHKAYLRRVGHRARVVRSGGKPSFLEVLTAHPAPGRTGEAHLLVKLLTGRFHQLRAMLAHLGAPLVADPLYGSDQPRRRRRDRESFYLEHVLLKYTAYGGNAPRVAHLRDDPDREAIAPALRAEIEALAADAP
jgi:23S rRNA-/tRNA-specific pseudouridylate synthase